MSGPAAISRDKSSEYMNGHAFCQFLFTIENGADSLLAQQHRLVFAMGSNDDFHPGVQRPRRLDHLPH
ncbi:hypothetical protein D3C72_2368360 [compost metagenome]